VEEDAGATNFAEGVKPVNLGFVVSSLALSSEVCVVAAVVLGGMVKGLKAGLAGTSALTFESSLAVSLVATVALAGSESTFLAAPFINASVALFEGLGLTSFHSASDIPAGFCGSPGLVSLVEEGIAVVAVVFGGREKGLKAGVVVSLVEPDFEVLDLKRELVAGSAFEDGLGVSVSAFLVAAPFMKANVAELAGLGLTSFHSASDMPAGF